MEGQLSTEANDDVSASPTRRRVLKASAALSATGVVGSGLVGSAAGGHNPDACSRPVQCEAGISFNFDKGTVGDNCGYGTAVDSVTVGSVHVSCDTGGFIDLHDLTRTVGPSGTFGAGYIVGVSTFLQHGTHTDVCINLFENSPDTKDKDECKLEWNNNEWPTDGSPSQCRSMSAMLHLDQPNNNKWDHVCKHDSPSTGDDHAYLCDDFGPGDDLDPLLDKAKLCGDGTL